MATTLKILMVEDSPDDAELIIRELRRAGYHPDWTRVETEKDFLHALKNPPDLVISDYSMPQFDGLQAAKLLLENCPDIPFILVSGTVGEEAAVEAMKHGAMDYLLKDRIVRLGNSVARALDQKRLRDERRQLEQQLLLQATALETAANGSAIMDTTGKILWVNPALSVCTGYSPQELIGQNFRLLKSGKHDTTRYQEFWQTICSGQTWRGEFINRRKDGSHYYDESTITPVRDNDGQITHFVAMMQDVTARKQAQEAARAGQELKIRQQAALLKLAAHETSSFAEALKKTLKTDAQTLGVDRVSYWRFQQNPTALICEALYLLQTDKIEQGIELHGADFPTYFKALETNPLIVAQDAQTDPRTAEFTQSYLRPLGIASMLDVPVYVRGLLVGVVCHEHLGDSREWSSDEGDFALSIGHMVSLTLLERERNNVEADMRAAKQMLAHVVSSSPAITYLLTIQGPNYLPSWISQNLEILTGFQATEALATNWWLDHVHPEDRDRVLGEMTSLDQKGQMVQEYRFHHRNGSCLWLRDEKRLLRNARGEPAEIVGSWSNITERKRAEQIKIELTERNESFVRALGEIVYDHNLTTHQIEWAGDTIKCIGWSSAELGSDTQGWTDRVHPDDLIRVRSQFETLLIEPLFASEYRFRHKAGHYVWVFDRGVMSRDAQGRITRVIGIMWDISDRKRAEEVLRENEERFRQLAENIQEVFWMTDLTKNQMIYISPGYEKIWGRPCAELYHTPQLWLEAIHPGDRERIKNAIHNKQTAGTYDEQYRIQRPDGNLRWVRDRAFPVRDAQGQVYRIVGIAEDITHHRDLEEQFRQVQKMEAVGQLAGGVAHDFNNLLTVIRGSSELLLISEAPDSAESKEFLHQIIAAADRAAKLTRQLLVFSRKQVIQSQAINLNELIENLTKMLQRIIGEDIHLHCELGADLPAVLADAGMLEQVVMNLVVNARDAMPTGGELTIRTNLDTKHGFFRESATPSTAEAYVCLSVVDGGTGIPAEILPHIFEPFYTTKEVGKGTGLGLATVYGIVQQHHGWVEVESVVGQGTTFHIGLPATQTSGDGKKNLPAETALPRGTETILLVEDEPAVRTLVRNIFQRHGYQVLEADSGRTALAVWREHHRKIDLLLTDLVMPDGLTGLMLAEQLQKERPTLKVIFSSGYSPESVANGFTLAPGNSFLQKPFNPQKLLQAVRDCLEGKPTNEHN
jgi:two-component system cell cycle sensor histidine kinase/response regulator CckA